MAGEVFLKRTELDFSAEEVFAWHERPGALARLIPPFERARILQAPAGLREGERAILEIALGPLRLRWVARHTKVEPGRKFVDTQESGPFARWTHTHSVEPLGERRCALVDRIEYALPGGALGALAAGYDTRRRLERVFAWRHATLRRDLRLHRRAALGRRRILITGATGLIGGALAPFLATGGHEVMALSRSLPRPGGGFAGEGIRWTPPGGFPPGEEERLEGFDAVIHLAGENIAAGRWTPERKRLLRESRVEATRTLCEALARRERKPEVLICASGVGGYGPRGEEWLDEETPTGAGGYLPGLVRDWEAAAAPAREAGIRVVHLRIGMVLTPRGGALARMLPASRLGIAGRIGSGGQYLSWISIEDLIGAIHRCLADRSLSGPVNAVAPNPVTQAEFARTLARVLRRPLGPPAPAALLRALFGELADAVLLTGQRVRPGRLILSGYEFRHITLEEALRDLLGK